MTCDCALHDRLGNIASQSLSNLLAATFRLFPVHPACLRTISHFSMSLPSGRSLGAHALVWTVSVPPCCSFDASDPLIRIVVRIGLTGIPPPLTASPHSSPSVTDSRAPRSHVPACTNLPNGGQSGHADWRPAGQERRLADPTMFASPSSMRSFHWLAFRELWCGRFVFPFALSRRL